MNAADSGDAFIPYLRAVYHEDEECSYTQSEKYGLVHSPCQLEQDMRDIGQSAVEADMVGNRLPGISETSDFNIGA